MAWYAVALLLLVTWIPGFDAQDDIAMRVCQAYYSVIDGKLVVIRGNGWTGLIGFTLVCFSFDSSLNMTFFPSPLQRTFLMCVRTWFAATPTPLTITFVASLTAPFPARRRSALMAKSSTLRRRKSKHAC